MGGAVFLSFLVFHKVYSSGFFEKLADAVTAMLG
jgi:hypothetical protein